MKPTLTREQAAEALDVNVRTVDRWADDPEKDLDRIKGEFQWVRFDAEQVERLRARRAELGLTSEA